jgi:hypothetical protein
MRSEKWLTVPKIDQEAYLSKIIYYTLDENFSNFRSDSEWKIWESGDKNIGRISLDFIKSKNNLNLFLKHKESFMLNDSVGAPVLFDFPEISGISSSTIQYASDTINIHNLIKKNTTSVNRVVEIGAGFGGLCRAISVLIDFNEYIIIDLPEVIALQRKYLGQYSKIFNKVKFVNALDDSAIEQISQPDLTIACASIAELDLKTQVFYNKTLISKSKYAYVSYNTMFRKDSVHIFNSLYQIWVAKFSIRSWKGLQGIYFAMKSEPNRIKRFFDNIFFQTTPVQFNVKVKVLKGTNRLKNQIKSVLSL